MFGVAGMVIFFLTLPVTNILINIIYNCAMEFSGIVVSKADIYPPASLALTALCVYLSYYKETDPWETLFLPEFTQLLLLYAVVYLLFVAIKFVILHRTNKRA